MAGGFEFFTDDFGQESGSGPDSDSWYGSQELGKRVCINELLHLNKHVGPLRVELGQLLRQDRQNRGGGIGAGHHHGLGI